MKSNRLQTTRRFEIQNLEARQMMTGDLGLIEPDSVDSAANTFQAKASPATCCGLEDPADLAWVIEGSQATAPPKGHVSRVDAVFAGG